MHRIGYTDQGQQFVPLLEIPTSLEEMDGDTFIFFCGLCEKINEGAVSLQQAAVSLALELLGELPATYNDKAKENVAFVAQQLEPLFSGELEKRINPVRSLRCGDRKVHSLGYGFFDATAGQYLNIVTAIHRFYREKEAVDSLRKALQEGTAPPDVTGDALSARYTRAMEEVIAALYPTRHEKVAASARRRIASLPAVTKGHLVSYAIASHVYLATGTFHFYSVQACFRDIFGGPAQTDGNKASTPRDADFADALSSVAEAGAFGDYQKVLRTNIIIILRYMQKRWREAKNIQEHAKRK